MSTTAFVAVLVGLGVVNASHSFSRHACTTTFMNVSQIPHNFTTTQRFELGNGSRTCEISLPVEVAAKLERTGAPFSATAFKSVSHDSCLQTTAGSLILRSAAVDLELRDSGSAEILVQNLVNPINVTIRGRGMTIDTECFYTDSTGEWSNEGITVVMRNLTQNIIRCEAHVLSTFVAADDNRAPEYKLYEGGGIGLLVVIVLFVTISLYSVVALVITRHKRRLAATLREPTVETEDFANIGNPMFEGGAGRVHSSPESSGKKHAVKMVHSAPAAVGSTDDKGTWGGGGSGGLALPTQTGSKQRTMSLHAEHHQAEC